MLLISHTATLRWGLTLGCLLVSACGSQSTQPEDRMSTRIAAVQVLSHHVPVAVSNGQAALAGALPAGQKMHVAIALPLRNQAGLTSLLSQLYDPSSPKYRQFLSVEQFTEQFGPKPEDFQTVVSFAQANGMTVTDTPKNRLLVPINATVDRIQNAFHVTMNSYRHPTEGRIFFAPDREPSLNLNVPVTHISGLNNFSLPHPAVTGPYAPSGPNGSYLGSDMRAAYYVNPTTNPPTPLTALTGSGQTVGLYEAFGYNLTDVNATFSTANQAYSVPIVNVLLGDAVPGPDGNFDGEDVLDIAAAIGMAPGLSQVRVYIGPAADAFNKMATENIAKQISSSDGYGEESSAEDSVFQEMALQGQSIFIASGDFGSTAQLDDAYVTIVGGTNLPPYVVGGAWPETAWGGSNGGISLNGVPIPTWQAGVSSSLNGASPNLRNVPDVAANAGSGIYICTTDPVVGFECSTWFGTSLASPLWAGFMALVNQQAVETGNAPKGGVGFINPALYAIYANGEGANYNSDFHDIKSGGNIYNLFNAVPGYDLVTGLGSPNGQPLINDLAGPAASGFTLTNSNITTALSISPGGASGTTTITVNGLGGFTGSVTLAASGLPSGVAASFGSNPTIASSALKLTASSTATAGAFTVTVTGVSGTKTATTSFVVTVGATNFALSASANFLTQAPGTAIADTITVTDLNGFDHSITLTASGLPSGVTASFSPNPTTPAQVC